MRRRITLLGCALALAVISAPGQAPAPVAPAQIAATQPLAPQQLDNLVAPIALYPDPLLSQVLAASTYPVELVEAEQWLAANPRLQGQQLMDAARQQNWDPSVEALVAMPNVLALLTQDVQWTTDLGNAFLAQQSDVMNAVQQMRQRAQANGQLQTNSQETVTDQDQGDQQAIEIQPAVPQEIYVPSYDPYYVYGYGDYPPLYYPDGYWFEPGIDVGLYFGGWGGWGLGGWGWGCNWFGGGLYVNNVFFNRYGFRDGDRFGGGRFGGGFGGRTAWEHNPAHRLGAGYSNGALNARFGAASQASRIASGRSGNWHTFGGAGGGSSFRGSAGANSFRGSAGANSFRGSAGGGSSFRGGTGANSFRGGAGVNSFRGSAPQAGLRGAQSFRSTPNTQRYSGGQSYRSQAPARSYSAPQRSFQSAPRSSAPSFRGSVSRGGSFAGGGGARSFGGGGGGARSSGGSRGGGRR